MKSINTPLLDIDVAFNEPLIFNLKIDVSVVPIPTFPTILSIINLVFNSGPVLNVILLDDDNPNIPELKIVLLSQPAIFKPLMLRYFSESGKISILPSDLKII